MKILGIETSCDETAAAVLEIKQSKFNLLSNIVSSQIKTHAKFGGIVPEVAARMQSETILPVIDQALKQAATKPHHINYIAVTHGPGLITSLIVGLETAKTLSFAWDKPLIPVNHIAAHLLANYLSAKPSSIKYPAVGLIVSGGHTQLVLMKNKSNYKIIGQSVDDAVGEAFDKVAKILGLGYPGGPIISQLAQQGKANVTKLPRPMISQPNFNFSFSGLKTAVLYSIKNKKLNQNQIANYCASFQQACVDVLLSKTLRAIKNFQPKSFLLGGGVAANPLLRKTLQEKISKNFESVSIHIPELRFTGDNAAMIAAAAYFQIKNNKKNNFKNIKANPNLSL